MSRTTTAIIPTRNRAPPLLAWPREVPIGGEPAATTELTHKIRDFLTSSELPKLLFHVAPGALAPPDAVEWMQANVPNLTTVYLGEGTHFIQEDYPDEIGRGTGRLAEHALREVLEMPEVKVKQTIGASLVEVWNSWDDFGNIARFNPNLKRSFLLNDSKTTGLGAERQCDFIDGKKLHAGARHRPRSAECDRR